MSSRTLAVRSALPYWAADFNQHARYKVAYGGRGSSKSWSFARMAVLAAAQRPIRILCARELQNSIKDSVHYLIKSQIEALGLTSLFDTGENYARGLNGSEFVYKGLRRNIEEIKSTENISICWIEEGQTTSANSWKVLIPTIRAPGSEIWVTYNPDQETDPTHQRFVKSPPPDSIIRKVNWYDNPWFPPELEAERRYLAQTDPDAYAHVWEGETWTRSDAQVLNGKWIIDTFEPATDWHGPYYGADWGFAADPSTLIRFWITADGALMIEYEAYGLGVEIDKIPEMYELIPGSKTRRIRADNSRPETINHVKNKGYDIIGAEKWPGSVEDGVSWLRSRPKIVIHERCKHTIEEARLWSYKTDRLTGDVLPQLKDGNDHCWDAIRYGAQPMIRNKQEKFDYRPVAPAHKKQRGSNNAPRLQTGSGIRHRRTF